jgi:hypothetical protein
MKQPHDTDGITPASNVSTSLTNTHTTTHVNTREAIADDIAKFGKMNMKRDMMRGGENPNKK